jgi:hypothetical protein
VELKLLFRWFIGLSMDNTVRKPTVCTKNRERLLVHGAVTELFNEVQAIASKNKWLVRDHFCADGAVNQAWAGHKSSAHKVDSDEDNGNFKVKKHSNSTHKSTNKLDAHLCKKGKTSSELRFMCHILTDNCNSLIASAVVTKLDGFAERDATKVMITGAKQVAAERVQITIVADNGNDAVKLIGALTQMKSQVAQHISYRKSAVPDHIATTDGCVIMQQKRKLIGQGFSWAKFTGQIRQMMVRGLKKVDQLKVPKSEHNHLTRLRTLEQIRLQTTYRKGTMKSEIKPARNRLKKCLVSKSRIQFREMPPTRAMMLDLQANISLAC